MRVESDSWFALFARLRAVSARFRINVSVLCDTCEKVYASVVATGAHIIGFVLQELELWLIDARGPI
jgi:hypothetical protein